MNRPSWDEYFMLLARLVATRSTCVSRKVGAVIVRNKHIIATGYNGSMPGVTHCSDEGKCYWRARTSSENKYEYCRACHAEANAIAQAARYGVSVENASIYTTLAPCYSCFKLLVVAGIKRIYYETLYKIDYNSEEWQKIIREANIEEVKQIVISPDLFQRLRNDFVFLEKNLSENRIDDGVK